MVLVHFELCFCNTTPPFVEKTCFMGGEIELRDLSEHQMLSILRNSVYYSYS
jgi:hypothetical protein